MENRNLNMAPLSPSGSPSSHNPPPPRPPAPAPAAMPFDSPENNCGVDGQQHGDTVPVMAQGGDSVPRQETNPASTYTLASDTPESLEVEQVIPDDVEKLNEPVQESREEAEPQEAEQGVIAPDNSNK